MQGFYLLGSNLLLLLSIPLAGGGLRGRLAGLAVHPGANTHHMGVDGAGHAVLQLDVDFGELVVYI